MDVSSGNQEDILVPESITTTTSLSTPPSSISWGNDVTSSIADLAKNPKLGKSARKKLIAEGRRRMDEYRKRSGSSPSTLLKTPLGNSNKPNHTVPFTPVARGLNHQLEKLKRDELDLAAAEWSEQRNKFSELRESFEEEIEELKKTVSAERELKEKARTELSLEQAKSKDLRAQVQSLASELEERARETVNRLARRESEKDSDIALLNDKIRKLEDELLQKSNAMVNERLSFEEQTEALESKIASITESIESEQVETLQTECSNYRARIDQFADDLSRARLESQQLQRDKTDIQENLQIALENNRKLQNELSSAKHVEDVGAELSKVREEADELRLLKQELEGQVNDLNESLEKSIATTRQEQEANASLRRTVEEKNEMIVFLEGKIGEKSEAMEAVRRIETDYDALKVEHRALKSKLAESKELVKTKDNQVVQEANTRRKAETLLRELEESHVKELREQKDKFSAVLREQRKADELLLSHAEKDAQLDKKAVQQVEEEICVLRNQLQLTQRGNDQGDVIAKLNGRVVALEQANLELQQLVGVKKNTNALLHEEEMKGDCHDHAHTIHQLTLEVEEGKRTFERMRNRLSESGLCESDYEKFEEPLSYSEEDDESVSDDMEATTSHDMTDISDLRQEVGELRRLVKKAQEKQAIAESKTAFLQSEFTDLFVQYFAKETKKKKKSKKLLTAAGTATRRKRVVTGRRRSSSTAAAKRK